MDPSSATSAFISDLAPAQPLFGECPLHLLYSIGVVRVAIGLHDGPDAACYAWSVHSLALRADKRISSAIIVVRAALALIAVSTRRRT